MNNFFKNILALLGGIILGAMVNGGIIALQPFIAPLPEGIDPNDIESLSRAMNQFSVGNFIMPFLAHALGTLSGAYVTVRLTRNKHLFKAMTISVIFLIGGIQMAMMLPAPLWFEIMDLTLAYLPMGWLAYRLGHKAKGHESPTQKI